MFVDRNAELRCKFWVEEIYVMIAQIKKRQKLRRQKGLGTKILLALIHNYILDKCCAYESF